MKTTKTLGIVVAALTASLAASGCSTESFCWNCADDDAGTGDTGLGGSSGAGYGGMGGGFAGGAGTIIITDGGGGASDACMKSHETETVCDGIDDDCNGEIDEKFDLTKDPRNCGVCSQINNDADCTQKVQNANKALCTATVGKVGTCDYDSCAADFWDLDGNRANGCEYYCVKKGDTDTTCDNIDDDCNSKFDDGVDKCTSAENCGKCGRNCKRPNATGKCVATGNPGTCDEGNTQCEFVACDTGWVDADNANKPAMDLNGCEYKCTPTGPEICDGLDNDCDGLIDGTDGDLTGVNTECYGSNVGECGQPSHKGITRCVAAAIKCVDDNTGTTECTGNSDCSGTTPFCIDAPTPGKKVCGTKVIKVGDVAEICNTKDDDCNGTKDDFTTDSGTYCGTNAGICSQGKTVCNEQGELVCSGQTVAQQELCNGADDNCDGVIDGVAATPIVVCTSSADCASQPLAKLCLARLGFNDSVCSAPADDMHTAGAPLACDVPTPAPAGWTSACQPGTLACQGGTKLCVGSVKSTAADTCGKDNNCDGIKSPDFDLMNDPRNCGSCGNDCTAGGGFLNWKCSNGTCQVDATTKCLPGRIDCTDAPGCETACTFYSQKELCNGVDDNCDCHIDEMAPQYANGIEAPTPSQVCGVSLSATSDACKNTAVTCSAGKWTCTFPAGICDGGNPPSCATTQDICDNQDNNCNGNIDENFKQPVLNQGYIGQTCYSDDGATTKHGLCRQSGTYKCDGVNATACFSGTQKISGVKLDCNTLAGGCTEQCDGQDNDCDGVADEPYTAKGDNPTYFVKPAVVPVNNIWVHAYEASRPNADLTQPGSGNGWWRTTGSDAEQPDAPPGVPLDKTPACSASGRVPWFNISGSEAQHVCKEMGGRLCKNSEWQSTCKVSPVPATECFWGFESNCRSYSTSVNRMACNLGPYIFDPVAGIQDGLLPTGALPTCNALWATGKVFDVTGNLRELTCGGTGNCTNDQNSFVLMGGAFNTQEPSPYTGEGAKCNFTFYNVDKNFKLFDVGFRCCFDNNPS